MAWGESMRAPDRGALIKKSECSLCWKSEAFSTQMSMSFSFLFFESKKYGQN